MFRNERGFTMVEALVSLALTSIIAVAAISLYMNFYRGSSTVHLEKKLSNEAEYFTSMVFQDLLSSSVDYVYLKPTDTNGVTAINLYSVPSRFTDEGKGGFNTNDDFYLAPNRSIHVRPNQIQNGVDTLRIVSFNHFNALRHNELGGVIPDGIEGVSISPFAGQLNFVYPGLTQDAEQLTAYIIEPTTFELNCSETTKKNIYRYDKGIGGADEEHRLVAEDNVNVCSKGELSFTVTTANIKSPDVRATFKRTIVF
ncbi:MAG: PilW family protein [Bacilli bacterium]